jgi:hypothetical protein
VLLGCLDFEHPGGAVFYGFCKMARALGHDVELISYDGTPQGFLTAYNRCQELVDEATALFVPRSTAIYGFADENRPTLADRIRVRVKNGARLFVQPTVDALDKWNSFLAPYDLAVLSALKICGRVGTTLDCAPNGKVTIRRSPDSFRDPSLFQGVELVSLDQACAIWYFGDSMPVLLASDSALPVDANTDFLPRPEPKNAGAARLALRMAAGDQLPPEWNARELACMAVSYGEDRGAVLASIGLGLYDPVIEENRRLAANLIEWLFAHQKPLSPEERCRRVEVNLADFVLGVVRRAGDEWWTRRIPLPIRQKCAERQEEEACRWPKEAYFDLIDFKTIIGKEWMLFEPHLRAVGLQGGKEKSLSWLDRLNELRRMVGHPLKKHVAGYSFSDDERELLRYCDELTRRLVRSIEPPIASPQ